MKKILISVWLMGIGLITATGQNMLTGYEYWLNSNYAGKTIVALTPASSLQISDVVQTAGLPDGLHVFSIRFFDNQKRYSLPYSQFFMKMTYSVPSNKTVTACEYWYDNDYASKITLPANGQQLFSLNTVLNAVNLDIGLHVLNIRFRDSSRKWSSTFSQFFYKKPESLIVVPEIAAFEYWFDNDFSSRIFLPAGNQEIFILDTIISVSAMNKGLHIFNIRFFDKTGKWSSILSQFFVKQADGIILSKQIKTLEYWFDNDDANKVSLPSTNQHVFLFDTLFGTSDLSDGIHVLTVRFSDNSGLWSMPMSQFFYKWKNQAIQLGSNKIVSFRFWIDDDFSAVQQLNFMNPVSSLHLFDSVDLRHVQKGMHAISFQFSDSLGLWSAIITDSIEKLSLPVAEFSYVLDFQCDSTTVTFIDNSIDGDIYDWDFGNGMTDTLSNPVVVYFQPGIYEVSLTITDTLLLTDSTITKHIEIPGNTLYFFADTACESYISPSANFTWNISGFYNDTIPNSAGCDSVLTIGLTIHPVYYIEQNVSICNGDVFHWNGLDYSVEGTYFEFQQTQAGCDSILVLNLTVNDLPEVSLSGAEDFYCVYNNPVILTGTPVGGILSGSGVTGNVFDPTAAGTGIWHIIYSYIDMNSCTASDTLYVEVDDCLNVQDNSKHNVLVFPNPAENMVFLRFPDNERYSVSLLSLTGAELFNQIFQGQIIVSINLHQFPVGLYIFKINTNIGSIYQKLIIKR